MQYKEEGLVKARIEARPDPPYFKRPMGKPHPKHRKNLGRWVWVTHDGTTHHPTQPAVQYDNGDWAWFFMGNIHRIDGPAFFRNGEYEYWIYHQRLEKHDWENHQDRLEYLKNQIKNI